MKPDGFKWNRACEAMEFLVSQTISLHHGWQGGPRQHLSVSAQPWCMLGLTDRYCPAIQGLWQLLSGLDCGFPDYTVAFQYNTVAVCCIWCCMLLVHLPVFNQYPPPTDSLIWWDFFWYWKLKTCMQQQAYYKQRQIVEKNLDRFLSRRKTLSRLYAMPADNGLWSPIYLTPVNDLGVGLQPAISYGLC